MSGTKNSFSSVLEQFMILQKNSLEIISKLSQVATSSQDSVVFNITEDDGTISQMPVPSLGFYKSEINRVENTVHALAGLGDSNAVIKMPDGTTKKIFESSVLRDPASISNLQVPSTFNIRNNWFFESFLNPLLYVSYDVAGQVPGDMDRAVMKRVIVYADTQEKKDWYDLNYKGRNDVSHDQLLIDLDANSIQFFIDEDTVNLPLSVIRYTGSFDVTQITDEDVEVTSNDKTVIIKKRKYKLNKLTYTDVLSGTANTKTIEKGNVLLTSDGSKYEVESVDAAKRQVILKRISGAQPISIGVNILSIYSQTFSSKEVQINVGFDEREVIFLKPIEPKFNVASSTWSPGTAIWTNELTIQTPTGSLTLESFYKTQVVDFGMQFLNSAKEKLVPSIMGELPNSPVVDAANFKVLAINDHKKDTKEVEEINNKLSQKVAIENEVKQLDEAINNKKNDLNNNSTIKSESDKRKIKADLESFAREKISKVNLYSSVVKELATKSRSNPVVAESNKYRVRGFWPIPDPVASDTTNPQEVIQFKIAYRYIKKDGNAAQTKQIEFQDNGVTKTGFFSNWNEIKTDIRKRIYNSDTGFYEWAIEDVSDADTVNINQLDIPISKGEQVQIKIKSISEAGWPTNPIESDWSDAVTISFPDDLQIADETTSVLSETAAEETRVKFQEELSARGLDLHLLSSFTSGDRYIAHQATDIASGFFTSEGKVIDVYEKIKSLDTELRTLRQLIETAKGFIVAYLIDSDGNITNIGANSTTKLFAGYYKELITSGSGNSIVLEHGKIITKSYVLRIENGAATPLELASYMPGGLSTRVTDYTDTSNVSLDYANNRKYDIVPTVLSNTTPGTYLSVSQSAPFQSAQVKSLWIYSRQKSVGLDEELYGLTVPALSNTALDQGVLSWSVATLLPINGCYLMPTNPTIIGGNPDVWNGTVLGTGGGTLTEFCIHKDHPKLNTTGSFAPLSPLLFEPQVDGNGIYSYPQFIHSDFFYKDSTEVDGRKQLNYIKTDGLISPPTTGTTTAEHYPAKIGFYAGDEYLIGRYTCGAYLYLSPLDYNSISVDGSTELAKRMLEFGEDKAINIPLVFQFRCSDKTGYIGGYRTTGNISNITYIKKIGLDIQTRNGSLFSFDVELSCKYEQDSLNRPVYIPNVALDRLDAIRTQSKNSGTSAKN